MPDGSRISVPALTMEQMVDVDHAMVQDFQIDLLQMMENAGRHLAQLARDRFLGGLANGQQVTVLAGAGGNGGGALVAARRLFNWGANVEVVLIRGEGDYKGAAGRQLQILKRLEVPVRSADEATAGEGAEVILDGMVGYSLAGKRLRSLVVDYVRWANAQPAPVLSLDVPTGMMATSGDVTSPAIKAQATLALALPKTGTVKHGAEEWVGDLYLADIGVPRVIYRRLGIDPGNVFAASDLIRLA